MFPAVIRMVMQKPTSQSGILKGQQRYSFGLYLMAGLGWLFTTMFVSCIKDDGAGYVIPRDTTVTAVSPPPPPPPTAKTYLALGDSYTIGASVAQSERFPQQTSALLNTRGISLQAPYYIATSGWTTANLLYAIEQQNPAPGFDLVSLLIGVNNQYQGLDTAEYRAQFTQCLQKAISLAGNRKQRVFVLSIPDYSVTPFAKSLDRKRIAAEIDGLNRINKQVCDSAGVAWLDVTQSSREALTDRTLIASDSLHFSGKEYARWAARLAPLMESALK
jgi:lysophospholipase L1-like esterase